MTLIGELIKWSDNRDKIMLGFDVCRKIEMKTSQKLFVIWEKQKLNLVWKTFGCQQKKNNILNCTRTAKENRSYPRPRSKIIQLSSPRLRNELLAASFKYNKGKPHVSKVNTTLLEFPGYSTPVFVCDYFSPTNKTLHAAAKKRTKEAGYKFLWIRNERMFCRKSNEIE